MDTVLMIDGVVAQVWRGGKPGHELDPVEGIVINIEQADVCAGMIVVDGVFVPSPSIATIDALKDHARTARKEKENGGILVLNVPVETDDKSKVKILGARMLADSTPTFSTPWVGADGSIYEVDAAGMIAISDSVGQHVAACFATYANCLALIDGGVITTTAEIDAQFA